MSTAASRFECWETLAQVDACLAANDISLTQVSRWRREFKILPGVLQVPHQYRGSETRYPIGTCAQIAAAARLFKISNRVQYVGRQLWWEGFPVDEKYWRPQLMKSARTFDKAITRVRQQQIRADAHATELTLQERMARSRRSDIVLSRIRARLSSQYLAAHFGVLLSVVSGDFTGFGAPGPNEIEAFDKRAMIDALDIRKSESDVVLGQKLKFTTVLTVVFQAMAKAFESDSLLDFAQGPAQAISNARDDVRNALRVALAFHDAMSWIYGPKAFGLRFAAWIARKQPEWLVNMMILGFVMLRQKSNRLLSSAEIEELATKAEQAREDSLRIREMGRRDRRFAKVFSSRRVRQGMRDVASYNNWTKEIELAREGVGSR